MLPILRIFGLSLEVSLGKAPDDEATADEPASSITLGIVTDLSDDLDTEPFGFTPTTVAIAHAIQD